MFIPTKEAFFDISPTEFEKYSLEILKEQTKGLENMTFEHNQILKADDGSYQIDGYIEFTIMGLKYKTLVECKHYKSPINREKVQILYSKVQSLGAQKGILISTSHFQLGAIEYAKKHGIELIQLTEASVNYETRGQLNVIMQHTKPVINFGKKYAGMLLQKGNTGGITCSALTKDNTSLKTFLENNTKASSC